MTKETCTQERPRRLTTKGNRERAFKIRALRTQKTGKPFWHIGITTDNYFMLDLETTNMMAIENMAFNLIGKFLNQPLYLFKTNKSFWLVAIKPMAWERIKQALAYALNNWKSLVCEPFVLCCLKYDKATLRVSKKNGNIPKFVIKLYTPALLGGKSK